MKYNVGDKVRIIKKCSWFNSDGKMDKWIGRIMTIREIGYSIKMEEDKNENGGFGWSWSYCDECFELAEADQIIINRYGNKVVAKMGNKVGVARCNETDTFDLYTGVKIATDRLFGKEIEVKEVREVKRKAEVGEYIKIVNAHNSFEKYFNGDVLKVKMSLKAPSLNDEQVFVEELESPCILTSEYVVLENYKPQEEKYYNGKVVCVDKENDFLTKGKVYRFKDGKSVDDVGDSLPYGCSTLSLEHLNMMMMSQFIELVE